MITQAIFDESQRFPTLKFDIDGINEHYQAHAGMRDTAKQMPVRAPGLTTQHVVAAPRLAEAKSKSAGVFSGAISPSFFLRKFKMHAQSAVMEVNKPGSDKKLAGQSLKDARAALKILDAEIKALAKEIQTIDKIAAKQNARLQYRSLKFRPASSVGTPRHHVEIANSGGIYLQGLASRCAPILKVTAAAVPKRGLASRPATSRNSRRAVACLADKRSFRTLWRLGVSVLSAAAGA